MFATALLQYALPIHSSTETHPVSYEICTGSPFLEVMRLENDANSLSLSSAEVKIMWSYPTIPTYVFMVWCLTEHRDRRRAHRLKLIGRVVFGWGQEGKREKFSERGAPGC
jgi:hypothetical protein